MMKVDEEGDEVEMEEDEDRGGAELSGDEANDSATQDDLNEQTTPALDDETKQAHLLIEARRAELARALETCIFPAIKSRFLATKDTIGAVLEIADLKGLYRVFERC